MAVSANDLKPRIGKIFRIKVDGDDGITSTVYTARLERIYEDLGYADFHIMWTYIHPKFSNITILEGGLQDDSLTSNPADTITL